MADRLFDSFLTCLHQLQDIQFRDKTGLDIVVISTGLKVGPYSKHVTVGSSRPIVAKDLASIEVCDGVQLIKSAGDGTYIDKYMTANFKLEECNKEERLTVLATFLFHLTSGLPRGIDIVRKLLKKYFEEKSIVNGTEFRGEIGAELSTRYGPILLDSSLVTLAFHNKPIKLLELNDDLRGRLDEQMCSGSYLFNQFFPLGVGELKYDENEIIISICPARLVKAVSNAPEFAYVGYIINTVKSMEAKVFESFLLYVEIISRNVRGFICLHSLINDSVDYRKCTIGQLFENLSIIISSIHCNVLEEVFDWTTTLEHDESTKKTSVCQSSDAINHINKVSVMFDENEGYEWA
jgi:hypothetical protein